jgi:hypothetical protein
MTTLRPVRMRTSKNVVYLKTVFATLETLDTQGVVDAQRTYTEGFSQNSMFAAYTNICFA